VLNLFRGRSSASDTKAKLRLRVFGLQRSGNHAIISWIRRNSRLRNSLFLNQCSAGNPLQSFTSVEVGKDNRKARKDAIGEVNTLQRSWNSYNCIIVSYENKILSDSLNDTEFTVSQNHHDEWITIAIKRSFTNWLASFYSRHILHGTPISRSNRSATFVAKFLVIYKDLLHRSRSADVLSINYDLWLRSEEYRKRVLQSLALPVRDNSIGRRSLYGAGSSFDGQALDIDVEAQGRRWTQLVNDFGFRTLFCLASCDDDLVKLVKETYPTDAMLMKKVRAGADLRDLLVVGM